MPTTTRRRPHPSLARGAERLLAVLALLAALAPLPAAHEGPPFPVLVDEPAPPWSVTVWADPDVGVGTFYVQLEALAGHTPPPDPVVEVSVAPLREGVEEVTYRAAPDGGDRSTHVAEVDFPTREFWRVRVDLAGPGGWPAQGLPFTVEVTPPGYGPVDLLLYVWPFVAIAALWVVGARRRTAQLAAEAAAREGR